MLIERISRVSGKSHSMEIDITEEQLNRYQKGGEFIQNIAPNLLAEEREFILTGITPDEWKSIFGSEDK